MAKSFTARHKHEIKRNTACEYTINCSDGTEIGMQFWPDEYSDAIDVAKQVVWIERITGKRVTSIQAIFVIHSGA